ncbi:MAG: L-glutamate gamma-semialdehyde dehydrogenase [Ignavibacteriales bacterium]|nr:L-glutamate gamma-semialdehyde dehydrogenase [Ignavibacteriales bacterium]
MPITPFKNEPFIDYSNPNNRKKQEAAIQKIQSSLGKEFPIIIGGEKIFTKEKFNSYNPSKATEVVGVFQKGDEQPANKAMDAALKKFEEWKFVSPVKRAEYLFKAAKVMRKKRFELNAIMMFEVGKTWLEADGDTAEAIDFLEFYAREMLRYAKPVPVVKNKGERGRLEYIPLGVGVVIPPWNFPLAILTGMTCAALVTGNTVVLKPSSDSPRIAYAFMEIMEEIKLPAGVVNFVTGPGGAVGDTLVQHPKTRFVSFTGSKEVGIHINEEAAKVRSGQIWLKRVVAEMGGKDSIVIDEGVDLDEAAAGVTVAAFGFQGQKCSACSRVIVHEKVYDRFVDLLKKRAESITVGNPWEMKNFMGPVINKKSQEKTLWYIQKGIEEGGKLLVGGEKTNDDGYFLQPTIIKDVQPKATISQEEIFAPVLAVIKAKNFDHALEIANNTEFGLTGAVYTKNKKRLQKAEQQFHVGNLYLNRKCTGALVGVHPFGGFNMSGTDSKAGGRDYLLLFMQGKSIAEKVK